MRLVNFTDHMSKTQLYVNPDHVVAVVEADGPAKIYVTPTSPHSRHAQVGASYFLVEEDIKVVVSRLQVTG